MATHSSILPGKSHGQRSLAGYTVHGLTKLYATERAHTHTHTHTCKTNHTLLSFLMETFKLSSLKVKIRSEIQLSLLLLKTLLNIFKNRFLNLF